MQGSPDWHERAEWARAKGQQADLQESESKLSLSKLGWRDLECGRLAAALEGDLPPPSVTEPGNGQQNGAAWFRFEAAGALVILGALPHESASRAREGHFLAAAPRLMPAAGSPLTRAKRP
jgi:hypothetical protein